LGIAPTAVTLAAIPLSIVTGVLFGVGRFLWAGVAVLIVGLGDTIDGELSRFTGKASRTGAFIDSVVDRVSEALMLTGVMWYYQLRNSWFGLVAVLALVFSIMVSYVRARAEGIGVECRLGFFERPVRIAILGVGAIFLGRTYFPIALGVVALGSLVTALRRFSYVITRRRHS